MGQSLTLVDQKLFELRRTEVREVLLVVRSKHRRHLQDDVGGQRLPVAIVADQRQTERFPSLAERLTCAHQSELSQHCVQPIAHPV